MQIISVTVIHWNIFIMDIWPGKSALQHRIHKFPIWSRACATEDCGLYLDGRKGQTCIPINSIELTDLNRFIFFLQNCIDSILPKRVDWGLSQFVFIKKVIESIDFERLVWLNHFIGLIKNAERVNKIEGFPKKITKWKVFQEKVKILSGLIGLNHLSYSYELIESVHVYLAAWLNWLIY